MGAFLGYQCSACGERYLPEATSYVCPDDGSNLDVLIDHSTVGDRAELGDEPWMWRYLPLLPVGDPGLHDTQLRSVGGTPLLRSNRLGPALGLDGLWFKDDGRNPSASFKDRASALVVARAIEIGAETIVTASTGNAGAALAAMAAAADRPAVILAPKSAPQAKVAQLLIYGATVVLVDGTYDDAYDLTLEAAEAFGWYCRNTGYNPFTAEGKKTVAFEIAESFDWRPPDAVFISVGDGNIIAGAHKGFVDLYELGWIERIPRLYGVQSSGSAALANAFGAGTDEIEPVHSTTLADSISVDLPRDGARALRAVRQTDGQMFTVGDEAILEAIAALGTEAVFAEPAAAAAYAGVVRAVEEGWVHAQETVVATITGSGLKDVPAAMQAAGQATVIEPTLEALRAALA